MRVGRNGSRFPPSEVSWLWNVHGLSSRRIKALSATDSPSSPGTHSVCHRLRAAGLSTPVTWAPEAPASLVHGSLVPQATGVSGAL